MVVTTAAPPSNFVQKFLSTRPKNSSRRVVQQPVYARPLQLNLSLSRSIHVHVSTTQRSHHHHHHLTQNSREPSYPPLAKEEYNKQEGRRVWLRAASTTTSRRPSVDFSAPTHITPHKPQPPRRNSTNNKTIIRKNVSFVERRFFLVNGGGRVCVWCFGVHGARTNSSGRINVFVYKKKKK